MNMLNSLILEGNVSGEIVFDSEVKRLDFPVAVKRFYKNAEGEGVEEVSHFNIRLYGNMAEYGKEHLSPERGLRIVGRLKEEDSKVVVIAEHIEFKPRKF